MAATSDAGGDDAVVGVVHRFVGQFGAHAGAAGGGEETGVELQRRAAVVLPCRDNGVEVAGERERERHQLRDRPVEDRQQRARAAARGRAAGRRASSSQASAVSRYSSAPTAPNSRNQNSTPNQRRCALRNTASTSDGASSVGAAPGNAGVRRRRGARRDRARRRSLRHRDPGRADPSCRTAPRSRTAARRIRAAACPARPGTAPTTSSGTSQRQHDPVTPAPEPVGREARVQPQQPAPVPPVIPHRRRQRRRDMAEHQGDHDGDQGQRHGRDCTQRGLRGSQHAGDPAPTDSRTQAKPGHDALRRKLRREPLLIGLGEELAAKAAPRKALDRAAQRARHLHPLLDQPPRDRNRRRQRRCRARRRPAARLQSRARPARTSSRVNQRASSSSSPTTGASGSACAMKPSISEPGNGHGCEASSGMHARARRTPRTLRARRSARAIRRVRRIRRAPNSGAVATVPGGRAAGACRR